MEGGLLALNRLGCIQQFEAVSLESDGHGHHTSSDLDPRRQRDQNCEYTSGDIGTYRLSWGTCLN